MAKPDTIGNKIAPPRFLAFMGVLIVGVPVGARLLAAGPWGRWLVSTSRPSCSSLRASACLARARRGTIREHARANDANRIGLLVVTGIVMTVLMIAITAEAVGRNATAIYEGADHRDTGAGVAVR